jgi:hypothetical protein
MVLNMLFAQPWKICDRRLTRMDMYSDPSEVLKGAGLAG